MKVDHQESAPRDNAGFTDDFSQPCGPGRVIGSKTPEGFARKGIDREKVLQIDNGALRIQPLIRPGWGRAGISYGPYRRANGLAFAVFLLNGHNSSQTGAIETFRARLRRWLLGSETEGPGKRLIRLLGGRQKRFLWRRFLQWALASTRFIRLNTLDENLAVGWFPSGAPGNPGEQGNSIMIHSAGPECGELWGRVRGAFLRSTRGVQNIPMYYLVVLRERGAAYYAATLPGVAALSPYPSFRLLGIDAFECDKTVYAGLHQGVLGQIGFRAKH